MNPEAIRAKMAELTAEIEAMGDGSTYSDEQTERIDSINAEFEALDKQLVTAEKVEAMKAKAKTSAGRKVAPATTTTSAATPRVEVGRELTAPFKNAGEFFMAVKSYGQNGEMPTKLKNVMYERDGESGGFMVPEDISTDIIKKMEDPNESLLARCRQFQIGGNALSLPIDEQNPWSSGVMAYWTAEGAPIKPSQFVLSSAHFRLHKLACMVPVTDELLDDASAIESYIRNAAPAAITQKINEAIVAGNGVGKPMGFLNSPFTLAVAKEAGQAADSVLAENLLKMEARMIPQSRSRAVWLMNAAIPESLNGLKDAQGNYIFLKAGNNLSQGGFDTLLGHPIMPMMSSLPQIGDRGDINLVDMNYYFAVLKAGEQLKQASSIHVYFDREITAFRFSTRLDGAVPFKAPVTTQYGGYQMSAFVTLADRA